MISSLEKCIRKGSWGVLEISSREFTIIHRKVREGFTGRRHLNKDLKELHALKVFVVRVFQAQGAARSSRP